MFAVKRARAPRFLADMSACGPYATQEIGRFHGDGNEIILYRVMPAAPGT